MHFIYIQSDNKQPFYVRIKERVLSSSESGYIILPKLEEGQHNFTLGFPKNKWAAINYIIEIEQKDIGLQLKKVDSTTWALYNIQTSELLSSSESNVVSNTIIENNTDEFSNVLAEVSNTPSVKQKKIITEPATVTTVPLVVSGNVANTTEEKVVTKEEVNADNNTNKTVVESNLKNTEPAYVKSEVSKEFSFLDNTGRSLTYKIKDGEKEETVVVFISYEKDLSKILEQKKADDLKVAVAQVVSEEKNQQSNVTIKSDELSKGVVVTNKNCTQFADQDDFIKLRRSMAQEDTEGKMIELALVEFSKKCFSAEQVKNLAVLLLKESNRLIFLQMSVSHISDVQNFNRLQDLITSEENISKFKEIQY